MDQALRDDITGYDHDLKHSGVQAMYLASFRVSTYANCFRQNGGPPVHTRNYLGLALLDRNLDIIEGTDTVVEANRGFPTKQNKFVVGNTTYNVPKQKFQYCRLFIMSQEALSGIYMTCDAFVVPIQVHRRIGNVPRKATPLDNEFGSGLELTLLNKHYRISVHGKNYNIITSNATGYVLEIWPEQPHETHFIRYEQHLLSRFLRSNEMSPIKSMERDRMLPG